MNKLIIFGAGGHALAVYSIAKAFFKKIYFVAPEVDSDLIPLSLHYKSLDNIDYHDCLFFVAIGDNHRRMDVFLNLKYHYKKNKFINIIDKNSKISDIGVEFGENILVMANTHIGPGVKLRDGAIVNNGASVDHECYIGAFSSIAPGVILGGNVSLGSRVALCIGTTIIHNIRIGDDVVVGASSLVLRDLPSNSLAYGIPARIKSVRNSNDKYL